MVIEKGDFIEIISISNQSSVRAGYQGKCTKVCTLPNGEIYGYEIDDEHLARQVRKINPGEQLKLNL